MASGPGEGTGRTRRRASVRTVFVTATLGLTGLAVAAAIALAILAGNASDASRRVARELESVRAMSAVQLNVLVYGREVLLLADTGDPTHAANRDESRARLTEALDKALRSTNGKEDEAQVREIDALIGRYIQQRDELSRSDIAPGRQVTLASGLLEDATRAVDRYMAHSQQSAMATEERVRRLGQAVTDLSLALALVLPFAVVWLLHSVRNRVYAPFVGLHRALSRYSSGETDVRAKEAGPPEVADMARSFNDLADSLGKQRQSRFEFLLAVAHDLRNPLAALKTTVALTDVRLRKGELTREQIEQQQRRMTTQVDRLNRMVGDLLDMTRVEAGRFDLSLAVCDVRTLAEDARDLFVGSSERHTIRLETTDEPLRVSCDRQRLGQVLDNLVSNAIKYSPDGGEIEVRVRRAGTDAVIEVEDHGTGIARKNFARIFEPFQRLQPNRAPGVGLGLSVAKRLVEAQGGRIEVESEVGVGSTFRVCLPLVAESEASAARAD